MSSLAFSRVAVIGSQVVVGLFALEKAATNPVYFGLSLIAAAIIGLEVLMLCRGDLQ
jgi:hypothetical protein